MRASLWTVMVASGVAAVMLSVLARVGRRRSGQSLSESATEVLLSTAPLLVSIAGGLLISGLWTKAGAGTLLGATALMLVGGLSGRSTIVRKPLVALLLTMLLASLAAVSLGLRIDAIRHPLSGMPVLTGSLAVPLTVVWLVVFTAAFSTTGRLEGLCLPLAGVASATSLLVLALRQQEVALASQLSASTAGASFGLAALALSGLRPPAGNVTAVVLGYLLATTSVVGVSKSSALLSFGIPLILFAVPMLGMTTLVFDRLRMRFVVVEVRQDVYRWLLNRGLPRHRAIVFITCVQAYLGAIVVLLAALRRMPFFESGLVFAACAVAGVPVFGRLLRRLVPAPGQRPEDVSSGTRLLDMKVDPIGMEEALRKIESFIASGHAHHVVTADTPALARAIDDARFRDVVNAAHMVTADGVGVVWAARVLGVPVRDRVPGVDLMEELCRRAAEKGYRVFFLGGEPGVAEEAAQRLAARFPGLAVAGTHHGYFAASDEPKVVRLVRTARPDILFVALGSPLQDYWIHRHLDELGVPVCVGVGGSLDVFAGRLSRAPVWMRRLGLEWFYRAVQEPWRIRRWTAIPRVIAASLRARLQAYWS